MAASVARCGGTTVHVCSSGTVDAAGVCPGVVAEVLLFVSLLHNPEINAACTVKLS